MIPDGLSMTLAVAASWLVGVVLLVVAWALCEELAHAARSGGRAAQRRQRGALICFEGGGQVAARDILERAAARRVRLHAVSRDVHLGQGRTGRALRLVVTTPSAESLGRARRRRAGVSRRHESDAGRRSDIGRIGLHPLAG